MMNQINYQALYKQRKISEMTLDELRQLRNEYLKGSSLIEQMYSDFPNRKISLLMCSHLQDDHIVQAFFYHDQAANYLSDLSSGFEVPNVIAFGKREYYLLNFQAVDIAKGSVYFPHKMREPLKKIPLEESTRTFDFLESHLTSLELKTVLHPITFKNN